MESKDESKEIDPKNLTCYYFDDKDIELDFGIELLNLGVFY